MNTKELFAALEMLEKEKGIPMDYMIENIEKVLRLPAKITTAVTTKWFSKFFRTKMSLM